eukprot:11154976-Lingulodinium_polyedra.AAC.1
MATAGAAGLEARSARCSNRASSRQPSLRARVEPGTTDPSGCVVRYAPIFWAVASCRRLCQCRRSRQL